MKNCCLVNSAVFLAESECECECVRVSSVLGGGMFFSARLLIYYCVCVT